MQVTFNLSGKRVLVTGGASGIGLGAVRVLARWGGAAASPSMILPSRRGSTPWSTGLQPKPSTSSPLPVMSVTASIVHAWCTRPSPILGPRLSDEQCRHPGDDAADPARGSRSSGRALLEPAGERQTHRPVALRLRRSRRLQAPLSTPPRSRPTVGAARVRSIAPPADSRRLSVCWVGAARVRSIAPPRQAWSGSPGSGRGPSRLGFASMPLPLEPSTPTGCAASATKRSRCLWAGPASRKTTATSSSILLPAPTMSPARHSMSTARGPHDAHDSPRDPIGAVQHATCGLIRRTAEPGTPLAP